MPRTPLSPPDEFNFSKPWTFEEWIKRWERYRKGALHKESEEAQVNQLIYCMGEKAESKFDAFGLSEQDQTK